jgi:hypothetical protein
MQLCPGLLHRDAEFVEHRRPRHVKTLRSRGRLRSNSINTDKLRHYLFFQLWPNAAQM